MPHSLSTGQQMTTDRAAGGTASRSLNKDRGGLYFANSDASVWGEPPMAGTDSVIYRIISDREKKKVNARKNIPHLARDPNNVLGVVGVEPFYQLSPRGQAQGDKYQIQHQHGTKPRHVHLGSIERRSKRGRKTQHTNVPSKERLVARRCEQGNATL